MIGRGLLLGGGALVIVSAPAVQAQIAADLPGVVRLACAAGDETKVRPLEIDALSEAILVQSGYPIGDLVALGKLKAADAYRAAVVKLVTDQENGSSVFAKRVGRNVLVLGQVLATGKLADGKPFSIKMTAGPAGPAGTSDRWWFLRAPDKTHFQCLAGDPVKTVSLTVAVPAQPPLLAITKTIEDLGKTDKRATVDAAVLGVKVAKTVEDDGTTKKTTTLTFDGTVGLRVIEAPNPAFVYANYTLSKGRTKPAPTLPAGKTERDSDTDGLAFGFTIQNIAVPLDFSISAGASYVMDFVKNSRRGVGTLTLNPGFGLVNARLCGFGYLKPLTIGSIEFRTRCILTAQLDYSHVFKAGTADFDDRGDFVSLGPVAGFDVLAPLNETSGIVGNARYRWLPTIAGRAPTVNRWDLSLKYRWWVGGGLAFDLGGTYKNGEEFKTYTKEDEFLLTFGIVR